MADQRLRLLTRTPEPQYTDNSPVLLEAGALYLDNVTNNCIVQLKWINIDPRPVIAALIELNGHDVFHQELDSIQYQYDGFEAKQGEEFGARTPIILNTVKMVRYCVTLKAVAFSDGAIWRPEASARMTSLPMRKEPALTGELLDQLKRDLAKQNNHFAGACSSQAGRGLWQCGCGSWQYAGSACVKCGMTWEKLQEMSDQDILQQHLTEYKEEQEKLRIEAEKRAEEERIAREKEEQERREREEIERIKREEEEKIRAEKNAIRRKKYLKLGAIAVVGIVVISLVVNAIVKNAQLSNQYNAAVTLLKTGSRSEARAALKEMGEYGDCATLLKQMDADELYNADKLADAYDIYATLPSNYQTHESDYQSLYDQAARAEESGDYKEAIMLFAKLGKYKDSAERVITAENLGKEALARSYKENGQYDEARKIYLDLKKDEEATECLYLLAESQAKDTPWLAYNGFISLGNYRDSAERARALYGSRFEKIGEEDANHLRIYYDPQTSGYGLLNSNADVALSPEFSEMVFNANNAYTVKKDGKYGVIDSTGKTVIPIDCSNITDRDGYYDVTRDARCGILKADGSELIPVIYDSITENGENYEVTKGSQKGILKADGTVLIPVEYESITNMETGYEVIKNGKHGILGSDGKTIISPSYDNIEEQKDGRYLVLSGNKYGILTSDGTEIISPGYDKIEAQSDGRYLITSKGKTGIADADGRVIIEPTYDTVTYENTNTYTVTSNGKYGIIKYDGTVVQEAGLELIKAGSNNGNYLLFRQNGLYGFMDAKTFETVIPAEWKDAKIMISGYAYILNNLDKWGVIDSKGTVTVSPQWSDITFFEDCGYAIHKDGRKYYLTDNKGDLACDFGEERIEYLGNGTFRNEPGTLLYNIVARKAYSYKINDRDVYNMRMLGHDLISCRYRNGTSYYSGNYVYGIISISKNELISQIEWEEEIYKLPTRNKVGDKYGWIGTNGKDLIAPKYDFMRGSIINGYIIAANYNDRGNLVYELIDPSGGEVAAKNLTTLEEAYNYFGKPAEDMSVHGQLMRALTNAGFDGSAAQEFINSCLEKDAWDAEECFDSITVSDEFISIWSDLSYDIQKGEANTADKLLMKLMEYGLT